MTAHALKGRTGLLGMKDLHARAAALETAIDRAAPGDQLDEQKKLNGRNDLWLSLEQGVVAMCVEIQGKLCLATSAANAAPASQALPEERPAGLPPTSIRQLIAHLQAGDGDCDWLIADCLIELKGTVWAPFLQQALIHINNFNFTAASRLLAEG